MQIDVYFTSLTYRSETARTDLSVRPSASGRDGRRTRRHPPTRHNSIDRRFRSRNRRKIDASRVGLSADGRSPLLLRESLVDTRRRRRRCRRRAHRPLRGATVADRRLSRRENHIITECMPLAHTHTQTDYMNENHQLHCNCPTPRLFRSRSLQPRMALHRPIVWQYTVV